MTPEQLDAIKGRRGALGRGNAYEKYNANEAFHAHAEGDIESLLEEALSDVARYKEEAWAWLCVAQERAKERDEAQAAFKACADSRREEIEAHARTRADMEHLRTQLEWLKQQTEKNPCAIQATMNVQSHDLKSDSLEKEAISLSDTICELRDDPSKAAELVNAVWPRLSKHGRHVVSRNVDSAIAHWDEAMRDGVYTYGQHNWHVLRHWIWDHK